MKCSGCENRIKQALTAKDGIISAEGNHSKGSVEVEFDAAVIEEDGVIEIIEDAGFTVAD